MTASERAIAERDQTLRLKQTTIEKLTHENALLKRLKFGARTESYPAEQRQLFDEKLDMDLAAPEQEIRPASPAKPCILKPRTGSGSPSGLWVEV